MGENWERQPSRAPSREPRKARRYWENRRFLELTLVLAEFSKERKRGEYRRKHAAGHAAALVMPHLAGGDDAQAGSCRR